MTVRDAASLSAAHIVRRIRDRTVVDDVSLDVVPGELLVLVGPSGCGKSSLLRAVAGLDEADGTVLIDGVDVSTAAPERRRIGLVFQDHALFPHLRVEQNIGFGLRHLDRRERRRIVGEMLDLVRLSHVRRRYPHELSGGEQQRVALARALAPMPAVVLLDEPFASIDMSLRDEVRTEVLDVLRARGITALLVTHDRDEALVVGDRLAVMREGSIAQVGTPIEVYERPVDRFVAAFMGPAAFIEVDGATRLARPHHLALQDHGCEAAPGTVISGVIGAMRYLGAGWRIEVHTADGEIVAVDRPGRPPHAIGDRCAVTLATDALLHRVR